MEYSDVAEPCNPFWMPAERAEVQSVYDAGRTVAAPRADDGFDFRVVQRVLEVFCPFLVCPCESAMPFERVQAGCVFQAPAFHLPDASFQASCRDAAGRGDQCDFLPFLQEGWDGIHFMHVL